MYAHAHNIWADLFLRQFDNSIDVHLKSSSFSLLELVHYNDTFGRSDSLASFRAHDDFLQQDFGLPGSLLFSMFDELKSYLNQRIRFSDLSKEYPYDIPNLEKYKPYYLLEDIFIGVLNEIKRSQDPFVGYFHLWSPHEPNAPRREFVGLFDDGWIPRAKPLHPLGQTAAAEELGQSRVRYDEYIANLDTEFGKHL